MSEQPAEAKKAHATADTGTLHARWSASWTPDEIAHRLTGLAMPWYIAAGWALDLFRGARTREHDDIEIAIPASQFPQIRARFPKYVFDAVGDGRIWENATAQHLATTRQTWLRDPATGNYLLDVFREPHDGDVWIYRRHMAIRFPYAEIIQRTAKGVPYLRPELVLLFKAKDVRQKDQQDFDAIVPQLTRDQRDLLSALLRQAHPGHPWCTALSYTTPGRGTYQRL